ncbi:hypothetical protein OM076_23540 [Solirubrobacter ginsenosidimutans]|uniref:Uncharacterized protein n=1 Tax=Solirubrobacter ginsenosidimutans TaxID=490573 RepID=A0A9X3N1M7_9ACTN|nr:hypothetical protein [Solirubrobacter ginsenosidimutans]MDA0163268.1 hypothetical protein [Solirubrobacter ginsenosidimutans]
MADYPAISMWRRSLTWAENACIESALGHVDAAEASTMRMTAVETLHRQLPSIQAQVFRYLPKSDPRRMRVDEIVHDVKGRPLQEDEKEALVLAFHAAGSQRLREVVRLGAFFVVLVRATLCVAVLAAVIGLAGGIWPKALPLCFFPQEKSLVACPTEQSRAQVNGAPVNTAGGDLDDGFDATVSRADYVLVEFAGLMAAAVVGIAALRGMRGSSTPYRVPIALLLLKLPAGAITAVVGLLLMRGGFVPGLSALDSSAQIIAWAIVFGAAQQLVTGLIDQRAHGVLNDVGGRGASGDRAMSTADQ